MDSIQKAAGDFPTDTRFQLLLNESRKIASELERRDKTYAALADAEKQAVASGDAIQVAKSVDSIQKAAGTLPPTPDFNCCSTTSRKVASELEQRDKTYAALADAESRLRPLAMPSKSRRAWTAFKRPPGFPPTADFNCCYNGSRKVASELERRDKTYAALADAEKQAAASGDAVQVAKSVDSIQKAAGDFPTDSRFQLLLNESRKVASELERRDKTYAALADAEKQAAASGDAVQVAKSVDSIQKAAGDFPTDSRFQLLLNESREVASELERRDKTYAALADAEKQAAASGDAVQVAKSVDSIQKAAGDFPTDSRFQLLLNKSRKVASELERRDKTYAALADAEKQAAASGDAAQVAKSVDSIQKAAGDFPTDSRFSKLADQARKVVNDLQLRERTYTDMAAAERWAVASADAAQVEKSLESIQKAAGDFPKTANSQGFWTRREKSRTICSCAIKLMPIWSMRRRRRLRLEMRRKSRRACRASRRPSKIFPSKTFPMTRDSIDFWTRRERSRTICSCATRPMPLWLTRRGRLLRREMLRKSLRA